MQQFIQYFSNVPDWHRIAILGLSVVILWNIENIIGLDFDYKKWKHFLTNAMFMAFDAPVQFIMGIGFVFATTWVSTHNFGLLNSLQINTGWESVLASFLILDFFEYVYHVVMHKVKRFWMFHVVHHADRVVDVSTTLREHPGETAIRLTSLLLWVFLSGATFWAILFRQFVQIFSNVFAHANFRLPEKVDKIVSLVFVTPNVHHVHHHYQLPYTDSNYGDVLTIWDRLFGTFMTLPANETIFGIDTMMEPSQNADFKNLLTTPFSSYLTAIDYGNQTTTETEEPIDLILVS